jgi:hypothetical protein
MPKKHVETAVLTPRHHDDVLVCIVLLVIVNVMSLLPMLERPFEKARRDHTMEQTAVTQHDVAVLVERFASLPSVVRRTVRVWADVNALLLQDTTDRRRRNIVLLSNLGLCEPGKIVGAKGVVRNQLRPNPRTCNNTIGSQPTGDRRRRYAKTRGQQ